MAPLIKTGPAGVYTSMDIKKDDVVEVWTGAAIGSPYPPQPGDNWEEAKVVEVKGGRCQISWTSNRPGMPWVSPAAVREKRS